jgi:predicted PurR-regulated permease PerM
MAEVERPADVVETELGSQTVYLRLIAIVLLLGASSLLAGLLMPFVLAMVLAIALSPLAERIEKAGARRAVGSLACTLAVALLLGATTGLLLYETGSILRDTDEHIRGLSRLLARASKATGGDRFLDSLKHQTTIPAAEPKGDLAEEPSSEGGKTVAAKPRGQDAISESASYWENLLRDNVRELSRWIAAGLGGLIGVLGGVVVFLAFLYYLLETRQEWMERVNLAAKALGMRPRLSDFERVRSEIETYFGWLSMVAVGYVVVVGSALWAIGLPQPFLWGVMAGLLEFVPYFGPLIASVLPILLSLSLGGGWWQPLLVAGLFIGLHTVEGYFITPKLYGHAIRFNPVLILFGVLFFGWLWGPLGLAVAMPFMIILRGLVSITPEVPALDALVAPEAGATKAADETDLGPPLNRPQSPAAVH